MYNFFRGEHSFQLIGSKLIASKVKGNQLRIFLDELGVCILENWEFLKVTAMERGQKDRLTFVALIFRKKDTMFNAKRD